MGIEEVVTVIKSIQFIDLGKYPDFVHVLQICLTKSKEQWQDLLKNYEAFRSEYRKGLDANRIDKPESQNTAKQTKNPEKKYQIDDIKKWLFNLKDDEVVDASFYSPFSSSEEKPFYDLEGVELLLLDHWIKQMLLKLANDRRRKKTRNTYRGNIDLKALLRSRFKHGDELVKLYYRYPKKEKTKIVFLCDVSKSMDMYSRFISSLSTQIPKVFNECAIYFFNTALHQLRSTASLSDVKGLWTGGTRIGYCFSEWLQEGPDWVDKKTKILIYSDGWDTGDLELLDQSMYLMCQMVDKIIWLNPTIKSADNVPIVGMKVAQKYLDMLAPVYNLQTLKQFVREL